MNESLPKSEGSEFKAPRIPISDPYVGSKTGDERLVHSAVAEADAATAVKQGISVQELIDRQNAEGRKKTVITGLISLLNRIWQKK